MSRVSEGSAIHSINYSIAKTKQKLEDLQMQGSNLKRVQKPSDDPLGNMEILSIRSKNIDGNQFKRNASVAKAQLSFTENAIEELTELLVKTKELAIGQSSNIFDPAIRRSVAKEINQMRNQALGISNRRLGNKYIFAGHKTLTKPFNEKGVYLGDDQQTKVEVGKDNFVGVTFNGENVFFQRDASPLLAKDPLTNSPLNQLDPSKMKMDPASVEPEIEIINRDPASFQESPFPASNARPQKLAQAARSSIFSDLASLENALLTDNHEIIQELLPGIDDSIDRLVEIRTTIGSTINKIENAVETVEKEHLINQEYKSNIEDADVAELFTDLTRQKNVLEATYKSSAQMMNNSLMRFIN
ncbi:MAG: flagellar hook-associated protein FlgL [Halobacteriovoraceae bacterium]|jgi:flagellar hook-associated protein 3 FlgL|nr:flagellar hook-associated protein FlgL [Halobacteriovoraceae bacterium]